ncbi:MAG TPA: hypothetical protein VF064_08455, partial [Pyrinomonadaceae bacterium]
MSDYLWDKTGEPDAEVERLEKLLGPLGHQPRALELPPAARVEQAPRRLWSRPALAAAAALALMLLAGAWLFASRVTGDARRTARDAQAPAPRTIESARDDSDAAAAHDDKNNVVTLGPKKNEGPPERERVGQPSRQQQSGQSLLTEQRRRRGGLRARAGSGMKGRGGAARGARPREDLLAAVTERQQ